ncbi:hypothetical protein ILUMI_19387, partial [Ignelater luminosus]
MAQYANIENDVSDFVRNLEEISAFTQKVYLLLLLIEAVPLMIAPIIEKVPPLGVWTLKGHDKLTSFVIAEQVIAIFCAGILLWSLDCIYLGFCIEIVTQFKILCQYMEKLTTEGNSLDEMETNYLDKMKTCIRHHQLMLWFIKKFRQAFSLILLTQYLTAGPLICAELFVVFEGHSYQIRARHTFMFVGLTLQLSFYCISANYVADEALAVSNAVYCSKWFFHNFPSLKVPLLLTMQTAQRGITIKAGELVAINTETFVT